MIRQRRKLLFAGLAALLLTATPYQAEAAMSVPGAIAVVQQASIKPPLGNGKTYYVATNGKDTNSGLATSAPLATIEKAVSIARAGDTIYVRGGTYKPKQPINPLASGKAGNPITLTSYGKETVTIDGSGITGSGPKTFRISGVSYWNISNLNVTKAQGTAINIQDKSHHIRLENMNVYRNRGIGVNFQNGAYSNTVIGVNSYLNYDDQDGGENADGFGSKQGSHDNLFINCAAWNNSDDGFDFWESRGNVIVYSASYKNGYNENGRVWSPNSDGNGFKLGGSKNGVPSGDNLVLYSIAYDNLARGFDYNAASLKNVLYNTTAYNNETNYRFHHSGDVIRNSIASGRGKLSLGSGVDDANNSWTLKLTNPSFASTNPSASNFLYLTGSSQMVDRGVPTGMAYKGKAPDLGAFEFGMEWRNAGYTTKPSSTPGSEAPSGGKVIDLDDFAKKWSIAEQKTAVVMMKDLLRGEFGMTIMSGNKFEVTKMAENPRGSRVYLQKFVAGYEIANKQEALRMLHSLLEREMKYNVNDADYSFKEPARG